MEIIKQKLLAEPFSMSALKLARAIYFTHLVDDKNLYLEIKISSIQTLLNLDSEEETIERVHTLLNELNEPLAVKDFNFFGKIYPLRLIVFCKYKINEDILEIELSDEFLYAEHEYMLDSFLVK